ncbi:hypothetical protein QAD02_020573 [Eretmocerus hayati]|uniref:Uncharacterized protein n=1 Tax=Eretmocerus hayati TaxID=131215 RepID=A0ACC2PSL5_9HYME|nr:hypothetical protein QAD02_020573 [Eretmocerus hayati]
MVYGLIWLWKKTGIRDSKSDGGVVGKTSSANTLLRWSITRHITSAYSASMRERSGQPLSNDSDIDIKKLLKEDDDDVRKMLEYIKTHMADPFSDDTRADVLINISSGLVAPNDVASSLSNALSAGREKLLKFIEGSLQEGSEQKKSFYEPISRYDLRNFTTVTERKTNLQGKTSGCKEISPNLLYPRALAISSLCGGITLERILSYPLSNYPPIFSKPDGSRRKNTKSDLLHALEREINQFILKERPQSDNPIIIIDGIAVLQSLNDVGLRTFDDVALRIMEFLISRLMYANEVHIIFDRYDVTSLHPKEEERGCRYGHASKVDDVKGGRIMQDFKLVLANNERKSALTRFICEYLEVHLLKSPFLAANSGKRVILAGGFEPRNSAFVISSGLVSVIPELTCNHIEADTRIVFHAYMTSSLHANNNFTDLFIESLDTDVLLLLTAHHRDFAGSPSVWFHTGRIDRVSDKRRFIPIHILANKIGQQRSSALLALHAISGCDTTSSISGFGKKTVYETFTKMRTEDVTCLSKLSDLSFNCALDAVSRFMARLFDSKVVLQSENFSINSLRYRLAVEKNSPTTRLPPCESALIQHLKRSLWQIRESAQATQSQIEDCDPLECG